MKIKMNVLALTSIVACYMVACKKQDYSTTTPVKTYSVEETFETGTKAAYKIADVNLSTGSWSFDDALIGSTTADAKEDNASVRIRTGNITTNFQISGLEKIFVKSAKYGNDATSTWQMQVSSDSGKTFIQLGSDITDTSKTLQLDSFVNTMSSPVQVRIVKTGTTRINVDNITFVGTGESGISVDTTDGASDTTNQSTAAAARYVNAGSDAPPSTGDNSNLLLGNPTDADSIITLADNYMINQHYYIESYNHTRSTPNWVAWHLDATNTTAVVKRQDNFAAWAGLPTSWFAVQSNTYSSSGYERGHNCPSGDRTSSLEANSSTFLMTNMIPQTAANNEGTWNNLESYIRTQTSAGYEAYILMGSYGNGGTIANGNVTVPTNVWKIVVFLKTGNNDLSRIDADTRVLAVNTPNTTTVSSDWTQYIVTVNDIETATGYKIFSALSSSLQTTLKAKKDSGN
ncbi:DNA/RNA non-specific endonuclease [Rhizosphaericola mali]|uniref:DNA/RNA non-specific endonuclease n=1 Tax=Rhizosphaericola mali TaxID=2545455 RepID=A0A5P2G635_9BACT|nr:DNA/RNA non-specific endonuclease [Rhizosphaericola mali]QES89352.1 DNA/RNA non-specific endonuclease [Rhizosphaericola mali]